MTPIVINAVGGLALFLLAMSLMTVGLKVFGGQGLKTLLGRWTSSAVTGALSGAAVTAIVQSSSAVTVATIGFVNAGVLSLRQALGIVFGANVGTTMTGWLVSLTGIGFRIDAVAMPILAVGVALRLAAPSKRLSGLGEALAGFGLFFLGLNVLTAAFSGVAQTLDADALGQGGGLIGLAGFLLTGLLATVLTQSSSAAIAIILTASAQSVIGVEAAAAAVIGANLGTTSTALIAVIGATPNAKRVAMGHVGFNLITAAIALAILPLMLAAVRLLMAWTDAADTPVVFLAMFHTAFNLLGVALLLPFVGHAARRLERMFRTEEEDIGRPRHLDRTVLASPDLAILALGRELDRMAGLANRLALAALRPETPKRYRVQRRSDAVFALGVAIDGFATSMRMETLPQRAAQALPLVLRTGRYLEEAARLAPEVADLARTALAREPAATLVRPLLEIAARTVGGNLAEAQGGAPAVTSDLAPFLAAYQEAKTAILTEAAASRLEVETAERLLDKLSHCRRMMEQLSKAQTYLRSAAFAPDGGGAAGPGVSSV